ncbi:hypothetical protein EYF80_017665 [Liparis tanakae]|uniref:Uncharacterized protein n=1 Tax=Liparis tanakae TaxID=230148 RepID=A0A4Z2I2C4_9TELE|nr:hypothetical protein EYF80_017665 [Liparis tanakae]
MNFPISQSQTSSHSWSELTPSWILMVLIRSSLPVQYSASSSGISGGTQSESQKTTRENMVTEHKLCPELISENENPISPSIHPAPSFLRRRPT